MPRRMGLGLLPSSAVALGLALDFHATAPQGIADIVMTVAVMGSMLSETAGLWTTWVLARAHMISSATLGSVTETVSDVAEVVSDATATKTPAEETIQ